MGWEVSEVGNVSLSFSFVANNWALQELAVELLSWLGTQCWLGFPAASQQWILAGALRSDTPEEEERGAQIIQSSVGISPWGKKSKYFSKFPLGGGIPCQDFVVQHWAPVTHLLFNLYSSFCSISMCIIIWPGKHMGALGFGVY